MQYLYNSDGSNSSPTGDGPAGAAFVLRLPDQKPINRQFPLAFGTNNIAEMTGMAEAIEHFAIHSTPEDTAIFHGDSQWVIRVLAGELNLAAHPIKYGMAANVRSRYLPLIKRIADVWDSSRMSLVWIPRNLNSLADQAANNARKKALEKYS
jgi:ribonuclease HI